MAVARNVLLPSPEGSRIDATVHAAVEAAGLSISFNPSFCFVFVFRISERSFTMPNSKPNPEDHREHLCGQSFDRLDGDQHIRDTVDDREFEFGLARSRLGALVRQLAEDTADRVGFSYVANDHAPVTYQQLRGAFVEARDLLRPLPVPADPDRLGGSLFFLPEEQHQLWFYLAVAHVERGLSFTPEDRYELGLAVLDEFERCGLGRFEDAFILLEADLIDSLMVHVLTGREPWDRALFAQDVLRFGRDSAVLDEIRRTAPPASACVPVAAGMPQ